MNVPTMKCSAMNCAGNEKFVMNRGREVRKKVNRNMQQIAPVAYHLKVKILCGIPFLATGATHKGKKIFVSVLEVTCTYLIFRTAHSFRNIICTSMHYQNQ